MREYLLHIPKNIQPNAPLVFVLHGLRSTALYIKDRYPESDVTVLASSEIGTVGVGEGTTPNYFHLLQSLGFSERTLFKELKATKKTGIIFKKWDKSTWGTYYHNFSDMRETHIEKSRHPSHKLIYLVPFPK